MSRSKQQSFFEKKRVPMNLLQQNVFVLKTVSGSSENKSYLQETYVSQDEILESDGISIRRTVQEYPHTPESVNSYLGSVDYKNDIAAAVSSPAPGRNIGDVAALQELFTRSPEEIRDFFFAMTEKIANDRKEKISSKPDSDGGVK